MNKSEIIDMKLRGYIYYLLILSVVFSACTQLEEDMMSDGGRFNITLSDSKSDKSRSLPSELSDELTSEFYLTINHSNGVKAYKGKYSDYQIKQPAFKEGEYSIAASLGEDVLLALDSPYYESEDKLASIEVGKVTNVDLICYVANSLASFSFANTDQAKSLLQVYQIVTKVGNTEVSCTVDDGQNPYFRSGENVSFILKGTTSEGVSLDYTFANIPSVEKGKNYKYTISFGTSDTGNVGLDIAVDETIEDVTINETVPENWLPKPTVSAQGFNEHGILEYTETEEAVNAAVSFQSYKPIENVKFTLNFGDRKLSSLNKSYELASLSPEDKSALEQAGIVLPVLNSTSGELNFKNVISGLLCADDGSSVDNNIVVSVFANDRWSDEKQYTIRTLKPEFGVTVYPGNIWTKEFTVSSLMPENVSKGNYEILSKNMKYQFSTDGQAEWTDIDSETLNKNGLTPGTEYFVRPVYRNAIVGAISNISTYPVIELENGGLEGGYIERGDDSPGFFGTDYGATYVYEGWATTNFMTTPNCHRAAYSFNSRSGVRPTNDIPLNVGGINAVRIITLSYGYGGTDSNPKSFTHSELYLGENASEDGSRNYGINFVSRPTGMRFWYKCISNVGNDESKIRIELYNNETLLGSGVFLTGGVSDYRQYTLDIEYYKSAELLSLKPNKLVIVFSSGVKENLTKSDLKQFASGITNKLEDAMYRGNELFIDDISLVYDK